MKNLTPEQVAVGRGMENKKWVQFFLEDLSGHSIVFLSGNAKNQVEQNPEILELLRVQFTEKFPREKLGKEFDAVIQDFHAKGMRSPHVLVIKRERISDKPTRIAPASIIPSQELQDFLSALPGNKRNELGRFLALESATLIVESDGGENVQLDKILSNQLDSAGNEIIVLHGSILSSLPRRLSGIPTPKEQRKAPLASAYTVKTISW